MPIITTTTAAKSTLLVERATLKSRIGLSGTSADAVIDELLEEVTADFEGFLGRPLAFQSYTEKQAGDGGDHLLLSRMPIEGDAAEISVTIDGDADTEWVIADADHGVLFREDRWARDTEHNVVVTYRAGYLLPEQISTWVKGTAYASGAWVRPATASSSPYLFEATTAGTSADPTEPTWPTTLGGTVTDGTVVWTARAVSELPKWVRGLAIAEARTRYYARADRDDLAMSRLGPMSEQYRTPGSAGLLPQVERSLARLRWVA